MTTIKDLQITKFFDVKTPVGINQRGESLDNYSIGVDLYMPRITDEFKEQLFNANIKKHPSLEFIEDSEKIRILTKCSLVAELYSDKIVIYNPIQIPTGIGMLIPDNLWCEVRTKSSNFTYHWTEVHGTVDMNYTYGVGVQLIPHETVTIEIDQKFAQLVFHEAVPVCNITELTPEEFTSINTVQYRRGIRTGGFGSTGAFDEVKSSPVTSPNIGSTGAFDEDNLAEHNSEQKSETEGKIITFEE